MATAVTEAVPQLPWRIRVRRKFEVLGARGMAWLVRRQSRTRTLQMADSLARLALRMPFLQRNLKHARDQVGIVFPELDTAERERIVRESVRTLARTMLDFLRFPNYTPVELANLCVRVIGAEHWNAFKESNHGAVIGLGMHLGSWEYSGAWLALQGPMVAAGKAQREAAITDLAVAIRGQVGIDHFLSQESSRKLIATLRRQDKAVLGLIADQNGGRDGIFVPMCGRLTSAVKGPGALMRRYGTPAMLLSGVWEGDRYRMIMGPMIYSADTGDFDRDVLLNTARIQAHYEALLRAYPEQWLWLHRRWKTSPEVVPASERQERVLDPAVWEAFREEQCPELAGLTEQLRGASLR